MSESKYADIGVSEFLEVDFEGDLTCSIHGVERRTCRFLKYSLGDEEGCCLLTEMDIPVNDPGYIYAPDSCPFRE